VILLSDKSHDNWWSHFLDTGKTNHYIKVFTTFEQLDPAGLWSN